MQSFLAITAMLQLSETACKSHLTALAGQPKSDVKPRRPSKACDLQNLNCSRRQSQLPCRYALYCLESSLENLSN